MHIGLSVIFQNLDRKMTDAATYKHELGLASRAEEMGFDSVWSPEHHFSDYDMIPNVPQFLSWLASRTKKLKLGTMVTVLPWHDPVRVAENFALLDHLSEGRSILGIGRGLGRIEFDGFRLDMNKSRGQFAEYSEAVINALESGIMEYDGEYYKQPRVEIRPAPFKSFKGRSFASAVSPESFDLMAPLGVGLIVGPQKPWEVARNDCESYRKHFLELNNEEPPKPLLHQLVAVHEDERQAKNMRDSYIMRYAQSAITHYELANAAFASIKGYEYYASIAKNIAKGGVGQLQNFMTDLNVWGTPEKVAEELIERAQYLDLGGYMICLGFGGMSPEVANRNYELFSNEVLPHLKSHNKNAALGIRYGEECTA